MDYNCIQPHNSPSNEIFTTRTEEVQNSLPSVSIIPNQNLRESTQNNLEAIANHQNPMEAIPQQNLLNLIPQNLSDKQNAYHFFDLILKGGILLRIQICRFLL
jgi:hypothetical protein